MRARITGMAAVAAAAAIAAAGCSSGGSGADTPAAGPIVQRDNTAYPDKLVKLNNAERVEITGMADAAAAKRLNAAFRGPLDWAVNWAAATLLPEQKAECKGRSSTIQTKVRFGLRGEVVSAANAIQMIPCYEGEGGLPTVPVTVDVEAGKELGPKDVLTSAALTPSGMKTLWERLSGPKDDWADCELDPPQVADLSPGKRDGDPIASPAPAGILFTPQGIELIWSTTGTDCNNFAFTAPYDKVKDLIVPGLYAKIEAAAKAK
ncbi:hypothetical protein [Spirillospora albida]|uniref:hypothetical protein n=1 Tax=Spirillospora albida TaxID=58123 RepID=UPI0012F8AD79|nr:hypothetical protein [Spirillospora albida]